MINLIVLFPNTHFLWTPIKSQKSLRSGFKQPVSTIFPPYIISNGTYERIKQKCDALPLSAFRTPNGPPQGPRGTPYGTRGLPLFSLSSVIMFWMWNSYIWESPFWSVPRCAACPSLLACREPTRDYSHLNGVLPAAAEALRRHLVSFSNPLSSQAGTLSTSSPPSQLPQLLFTTFKKDWEPGRLMFNVLFLSGKDRIAV